MSMGAAQSELIKRDRILEPSPTAKAGSAAGLGRLFRRRYGLGFGVGVKVAVAVAVAVVIPIIKEAVRRPFFFGLLPDFRTKAPDR